MIRKTKHLAARAAFLLVIAVGLGFGVLLVAAAAVVGGLLALSLRLARDHVEPVDTTASPAEGQRAEPRGEAQPA